MHVLVILSAEFVGRTVVTTLNIVAAVRDSIPEVLHWFLTILCYNLSETMYVVTPHVTPRLHDVLGFVAPPF